MMLYHHHRSKRELIADGHYDFPRDPILTRKHNHVVGCPLPGMYFSERADRGNRLSGYTLRRPRDYLAALPPGKWRDMSVGQKQKFLRDVTLYMGHLSGMSERDLAKLFKISRAGAQAVLTRVEKMALPAGGDE